MSTPRPLPEDLFHLTPVTALCRIIVSGGLLPPERQQQVDAQHAGSRWGNNGDIGRTLVCMSLLPNWGVLKHQYAKTPVAVLRLDPAAVLGLDDVRPCPMNSALPTARPYLEGANDRVAALEKCLKSASVKDVEILVAGKVPLAAITDIILTPECCDAGWQRGVNDLLASARHRPTVGSDGIRAVLTDDYLNRLRGVQRAPFPERVVRKLRVYEIAKEQGLPSANVLARLQRGGLPVTSASSSVDAGWAEHLLSPNRYPRPDHPMPK